MFKYAGPFNGHQALKGLMDGSTGFRVILENLEYLEKVPFLRKLRENLENSGKKCLKISGLRENSVDFFWKV